MKISQTQLLEWVKDGNKDTLNTFFQNHLKTHKDALSFFNMIDNQRRSVIHWAAYLGQYELLQWWLSEYADIVNLNQGDIHNYNPVDLATIKGYNDEYDSNMQTRTVKILVDQGAVISITGKNRPNPLHWAYYYGNQDLIEYLLLKNQNLQFSNDGDNNYPIDYLFLENRPMQFQKDYKELFQKAVVQYVRQTNSGYEFKDLDKLNKKRTMVIRKNNHHNKVDQAKELSMQPILEYPERTPETEPLRSHGHGHSQAQSHSHNGGHSFKQSNGGSTDHKRQRVNIEKINQKEGTDPDMPIYDIENDVQREPEEEKFPENKINNSRLLSEEKEDQQFKRVSSESSKQKPRTKKSHMTRIANSSYTFEKFTIYQSAENLSRPSLYEHRLLYWNARLGFEEFFIYFLRRKCSPFIITFQGFNSLHIASYKGKYKILKIILLSDYEFYEYSQLIKQQNKDAKKLKQYSFDKKQQLNIMTEYLPSNALHLAIEQENYHCMKILIQHEVSINEVNHRCLKPFELTYNKRILDFYHTEIKKQNDINFNEMGYLYVIQTKGKTTIDKDIVYIQLQNIRDTFEDRGWSFEFAIFNGINLDLLHLYADQNYKQHIKPQYHYYVIKLSPDTIYKLANQYNIECYNFKNKYICKFLYEEHYNFEFPKDLWVQYLILKTLNDEFDVDKFMLEGLIISHFPLEDKYKAQKIDQFWNAQQYNCIRDSFRYDTQHIALYPLHALASYYGPVIAFYFALNVQIVGWLLVPSLIGAGIGLYIIILNEINSTIVPFYSLFMLLWSTLFMEKWKNRESELRFSWDMHRYQQHQPQRVMYTGNYVVNESNNKISIWDHFTTFKRRAITEMPFILIGIAIIIFSFLAFNIWQGAQPKNAVFMPILINSLNGASMTVLCDLYKRLCRTLVIWENHMFESEQEYSYVLKVFLFEFLISYVSVVYVAIFQNDSAQLAISVASIIITRGLISNTLSNGVPWIIYKIQFRRFEKLFSKFRDIYLKRCSDDQFSMNRKEIYGQQNIPICNMTYLQEKLTYEQQLQFLENLEQSNIKQPQKVLYDEYTGIAIQFGYTTMFAPAFPAAPLFFMINCFINLKLSISNYQNILKRERAQAADSIGIWLSIFSIMNYSATFMNCIVIGTVNREQISNLIGSNDSLSIAFTLVAVEHFLLFIKYMLDISIPDCPKWVETEMKRYEFLEKKHAQSIHSIRDKETKSEKKIEE